jgi:hypothetical protein
MLNRRAFLLGFMGGAIVAPLVIVPFPAEAQQAGKVYRIGWLGLAPPASPTALSPGLEGLFVDTLRAHGFAEGRNLVVERRYSEGRE